MLSAHSSSMTTKTLLGSCDYILLLHVDVAANKSRYDPDSKALTPDHDNFMVEDEMRMMVGDECVIVFVSART